MGGTAHQKYLVRDYEWCNLCHWWCYAFIQHDFIRVDTFLLTYLCFLFDSGSSIPFTLFIFDIFYTHTKAFMRTKFKLHERMMRTLCPTT